ncbi:glycosyltransferase [Spirosoma fluviale]|uniref:Glycosyltransferase involved in cell wall bisynthesis n=1 Tax=Spirosoma fluviale TaxID=1597977 RepID=A0A286FDD8_9BACT|nr:glycosyltransferase [Spirosoma fluviale]SOD81222.1 Glycosyltransferase involved in cell wall bisynthesis [Spirosoma fluviale]
MHQQFHLSIIIPVYNVENYILKCLESVLNQADETIEVICINDGSPDSSRQIISEYIIKYKNVKCIDRINGGLSAARNTGIFAAQGEYIVFLDSDDWLEGNVLSELYRQAKCNDLDVLIGNTQWIYLDFIKKSKKLSAEIVPETINGEDALTKLMDSGVYEPMAYNYIVRRSFLLKNSLLFKEGLLFEDELWAPQLLLQAKHVKGSHLIHYNYYQRQNTIMNSLASVKKIDSFAYVAAELIKISEDKHELLKQNLWFRACVLYNCKFTMQQIIGDYNNKFRISWLSLLDVSSSYSSFNRSLDFLNYTRSDRRIIRIIAKVFLS